MIREGLPRVERFHSNRWLPAPTDAARVKSCRHVRPTPAKQSSYRDSHSFEDN